MGWILPFRKIEVLESTLETLEFFQIPLDKFLQWGKIKTNVRSFLKAENYVY